MRCANAEFGQGRYLGYFQKQNSDWIDVWFQTGVCDEDTKQVGDVEAGGDRLFSGGT